MKCIGSALLIFWCPAFTNISECLDYFSTSAFWPKIILSAPKSLTGQYAVDSQGTQDRTNYSAHKRFLKGLISSMVMKHPGSAPSASVLTCATSLRLTTQIVTFTGPFLPYPDVSVAP